MRLFFLTSVKTRVRKNEVPVWRFCIFRAQEFPSRKIFSVADVWKDSVQLPLLLTPLTRVENKRQGIAFIAASEERNGSLLTFRPSEDTTQSRKTLY